MTLRTGHGTGAGSPRIEVLPPDELPSVTPSLTAPIERSPDGRFAPGNTAARSKRARPGVRGSLGLDRMDPRFRSFARWGARYGAHRRRELAQAHGGSLSAGASAIIESAAQAMAASRFVQALAAETGDAELFKQAAALASTARQHELAAWELAAREAQTRPRGKSLADLIAERADATLAARRAQEGDQ